MKRLIILILLIVFSMTGCTNWRISKVELTFPDEEFGGVKEVVFEIFELDKNNKRRSKNEAP